MKLPDFSSFFSGPAAASQAQQQPPPGAPQGAIPGASQNIQQATQQTANTAANGVIPAQAAQSQTNQQTENQNKSPLAEFEGLWQPPKTEGNNPVKQDNIFNVDPGKMMEAARKTDFSKMISPEIMSAIAAGGDGAQAAMIQAMNSVGQGAFAQSAMATTKIVEAALKKQAEQFEAKLPDLMKRFSDSDQLRSSDSRFNDPAVQPVVLALQSQVRQKFPNATTAEINAQVNRYLEGMAKTFAPKAEEAKQTKQSGKAQETDWSAFLGQ